MMEFNDCQLAKINGNSILKGVRINGFEICEFIENDGFQ